MYRFKNNPPPIEIGNWVSGSFRNNDTVIFSPLI